MFSRLRAQDPTRPLLHVLFYRLCRAITAAAMHLFYRLRVFGREHIPASGGLLVVANHQSHLDPPLIGVALGQHGGRNMASIAREGLFKTPVLGLLLRWLGAISIRQREGDAAAIRAAIAELKKGRMILIFPEGSRSPDGALQSFKRGAWLLMSRSGCDILPAAVEGAFDAWPRDRTLPRLFGCRCAVKFGPVISAKTLGELGPDAGLDLLAERIDAMRLEIRAELRRSSRGQLPRPGPGDLPRSARPA